MKKISRVVCQGIDHGDRIHGLSPDRTFRDSPQANEEKKIMKNRGQ